MEASLSLHELALRAQRLAEHEARLAAREEALRVELGRLADRAARLGAGAPGDEEAEAALTAAAQAREAALDRRAAATAGLEAAIERWRRRLDALARASAPAAGTDDLRARLTRALAAQIGELSAAELSSVVAQVLGGPAQAPDAAPTVSAAGEIADGIREEAELFADWVPDETLPPLGGEALPPLAPAPDVVVLPVALTPAPAVEPPVEPVLEAPDAPPDEDAALDDHAELLAAIEPPDESLDAPPDGPAHREPSDLDDVLPAPAEGPIDVFPADEDFDPFQALLDAVECGPDLAPPPETPPPETPPPETPPPEPLLPEPPSTVDLPVADDDEPAAEPLPEDAPPDPPRLIELDPDVAAAIALIDDPIGELDDLLLDEVPSDIAALLTARHAAAAAGELPAITSPPPATLGEALAVALGERRKPAQPAVQIFKGSPPVEAGDLLLVVKGDGPPPSARQSALADDLDDLLLAAGPSPSSALSINLGPPDPPAAFKEMESLSPDLIAEIARRLRGEPTPRPGVPALPADDADLLADLDLDPIPGYDSAPEPDEGHAPPPVFRPSLGRAERVDDAYDALLANLEAPPAAPPERDQAAARFAALAAQGVDDEPPDPWSQLDIQDLRAGGRPGPLPRLPAQVVEVDRGDATAAPRPDWRNRPPRAQLAVKVGLEHGNNFFTGFSGNISNGGLFIATHNQLPIGARVDLFFEMPSGHQVSVTGEVRWVRAYNPLADDQPPGMGFRFVNLEHDDEIVIERYIQAHETIFFD